MAAKTQQVPQDNTGSSVLSQTPPAISPTTSVLASVIALPEHPLIVYSAFACIPPTPDALDHLEAARRGILTRNKGRPLSESLLPCVNISKDAPTLYVFALGSTTCIREVHKLLSDIELEPLSLIESSSFTPASIYPCSDACSTQTIPCEHCLSDIAAPATASPIQLLPRVALRLPLTLFLQAVRERLIDDVAEASKLHPYGRSVTRLKGGFLLGHAPFSSEWGSGWESHAHSRPLIFCNLQVNISLSTNSPSIARLVIHPVMRPTYYLALRSSLPLPAGTPVVLLPHGVPAYYLSTYNGPTTALTAQFEDALAGLGAGDWKRTKLARSSDTEAQDYPNYVVVWLAVQNKRGEDKGMPVIWPVSLCACYHANSPSPHARSSLPYIPDLPTQLQASPPPPAAAVPPALSFSMAATATPTTDVPTSAVATATPTSAVPSGDRDRVTASFQSRPNLVRSSPTSDSLRAFRGLSINKKPHVRDVKKVASEVSGYVESVVKERERERERIRKDRQEQEMAAARAKLASSQPPVPEPPPVMLSTPEPPVAQQEPTPDELPIAPVELAEPESLPSVESDSSDHSVDSLFSPPDANIDLPSTEEESQAVPGQSVGDTPAAPADAQIATQPVHTSTVPTSGAFDPFSTFDSAWEPERTSYMDIDDDYGMDFNIDSLGGARTGGASVSAFDMNEEFTEDDFACFDAPPTQGGVDALALPSMAGPVLASGASLASLGLPPLVAMDGTLSGPGPPVSSWPTAHLGEPFTPRGSVDVHNIMDGIHPPELLPPSPTKTPSSHSAPATPSVHLDEKYRGPDGRKHSVNMLGPSIFDPIPFASTHRELDGKYAIGKFALPSPPADMDCAEPVPTHPASTSTLLAGWKHKYSAVTDPRIGVVRKLIGVKRKSIDQGLRAQRRAPHWDSYREPEEWQSSSPPAAADVDSEESEEEPWMEEEDTVATVAPRPSTPPPSYLPLGPTLLRTHFHHAHLLPMCAPLRPLGMAVNNTPGSTAMNSAPTPVSPAAVLGAASEKTKSLEAAAQVLVKEVVDNPLWSEAWRATASLSLTPPVLPGKIWQADARYIKHLIGDSQMSLDLQTLFREVPNSNSSTTSMQLLDAPMLLVGKGDSVIQLSPTSLRFWEKLGLSPRAGQKDVTAFVFFEGTDEERENEIEGWLSKISAAYSAKNFGLHVAGMSSHHTKPGLVPTRFDTLRKTLMSFVSSIPTRNPHLVFYIATPSHIISSSSTTLRQILSAVRRFHRAHPEGDILVHFVPETLILGTYTHPASSLGGLDTFVCSVYDRILQPVSRAMSRKFFDMSAPIVEYFEAPAYALISSPAGKSAPHLKISYSLDPSLSSLDVTHRHSLLHVGYQISACGRWILAACVDAEGEAHELKTWLTPDDHIEEFVVTQVWTFVLDFARRANIEWRIVVSKLGLMTHSELEAWVSHLDSSLSSALNVPPVYVTLLAVDNDCPWMFLVPQESGSYDVLKRPPITISQTSISKTSRHTHTTFSDATCATYSLVPSSDITLYPAYSVERSVKSGLSPYIPGSSDQPFVPDLEDEETPSIQAQSPSIEPMRVPGWSTILCAPSAADHASISSLRLFQLHVARSPHSTYGKSRTTQPDHDAHVDAQLQGELMKDIVRNFHELAVLSRTRWKLRADPALPFHLAALEVMRAALSGGAVDP